VARRQGTWAEAQAAYARSWHYYQATDLPAAALRVLVALAAVAHAQGAAAAAQQLYRAATLRMQQAAAWCEPRDRAEYHAVGALLPPPDSATDNVLVDDPLLAGLLAGTAQLE